MSEIKYDIDDKIIKEITAACKILMTAYKLGDSDLIDSIEWKYKEDVFILIANDYFQYVNSGRRPKARKVPVEDLLKWLIRKNIRPAYGQTINQLAFAVQQSIYKSGIKSRKFIDPIIGQTLDILSEDISEQLSEDIATVIAEDLTITLGNK